MSQHYLKHMMSSAGDLKVDYTTDHARKRVEISADHFDFALFELLILNVLAEEGIDAVRDDRHAWHAPLPPYRVFLTMQAQRYEIETHRLPHGQDKTTLVLRPLKSREMR